MHLAHHRHRLQSEPNSLVDFFFNAVTFKAKKNPRLIKTSVVVWEQRSLRCVHRRALRLAACFKHNAELRGIIGNAALFLELHLRGAGDLCG